MLDFETMSDSKILKVIGESIRGSRISQELTMKELAEQSEISVMSLSRIENGKTNPTLLMLLSIFKALGREKEIANLFPEPSLSPIYLSKMAKKKMTSPKRVRKKKVKQKEWEWGEATKWKK